MADHDRRTRVSSHVDKFAAMKMARAGHLRRTEQIVVDQNDDIYIENEAEYDDNDFVEDDMNGDYLNDYDDYSDYDDDTNNNHRISKVAMPGKKRKQHNTEVVQKRIAGAFIGAGSKSMVGPGSMNTLNSSVPISDDGINELMLVIDDEVDDANAAQSIIDKKQKKRKLAELAMFGQHGQIESTFENGDASDIAVYNPFNETNILNNNNVSAYSAPPPKFGADSNNDDDNNKENKVQSLLNMMNNNSSDDFVDVAAGKKYAVKSEPTNNNQYSMNDQYDPVDGITASVRASDALQSQSNAASTIKSTKLTSVPASKFTSNSNRPGQRLPQQSIRVNPKAYDWYKLIESGQLDKDSSLASSNLN